MTSQTQKNYLNGTHRVKNPRETLAQVKPHMRAMGITRIANITGLDDIGIPVVTVSRPNARALSVAQGKGTDLDSAKASGLMEAIENYHGENIDFPLHFGSFHDLADNHKMVAVDKLPKLVSSQFQPDLKTLWAQGKEINSGAEILVPYEMVHCDFSLPLPTGSGSFVLSTNGLASGNTINEAIVHGLCELIERDAKTLWSATNQIDPNHKSKFMVDLSTVEDPECSAILHRFEQANVLVGVWEITSTVNIPTFYCGIINASFDTAHTAVPTTGFGTHPCKEVALLRALTEAAQSRLTLISGSRDDIKATNYLPGKDFNTHKQLSELITQTKPCRNFVNISSWQNATIEQDLTLIKDALSQNDLDQVIVVDLTKPKFNIPVVRVIVPGLESMDTISGYQLGDRAKSHLKKCHEGANQ